MTALSARTPAAGRNRCVRRRAFTLIEVLLALAIFLLAMAVFGSMIVRNGQVAAGIEQQNLATRLCQSKLHEVAAGVVPMSSDGDQPFDEEPDYTWSLEADDGPTPGLWLVTVTVKRQKSNDGGAPIQCSLTQMVLDPSTVGSNEDVTPVISSTTSGSASSSSSSTSSTTSSSTTGAAAAPAAGAIRETRFRWDPDPRDVTCDFRDGAGPVSPCSKSSWRPRSPW